MKTPVASSGTSAIAGRFGIAPHQLCPVLKTKNVTTIRSAAGFKTLAVPYRTTYLLSTPISAVSATTYHGSCALRIIATINAVRIAPLGNSHRFFLHRRMLTSASAETATADTRPGATRRVASAGAAIATRPIRMMRSSPLGVRKKDMLHARRHESLHRRGHDEAVNS